jgi:O-methyltransferase involved in polyketide biosynthesis
MEIGQISKTALGVAVRRAAHQLMENPRILEDPIAVRLVGSGHPRHMERAMHPVGRDFRAFMAVRSRYTEDQLAAAVACGVAQYVILGAGLDTFAYRNPFPQLRVFEADFPATQEMKRSMLHDAEIPVPDNVTFVPLDFEHKTLAASLAEAGLDFEHKTLAASLAEAGLDFQRPAFFGWLGVIPYLTLDAFRATLDTIGQLPAGTGVSFDYALPPETLTPEGRTAFERLSARVTAAGEPFRLFFSPEALDGELRRAGFARVEQLDYDQLNNLYFHQRADGLKLSAVGLAMLATAWVG